MEEKQESRNILDNVSNEDKNEEQITVEHQIFATKFMELKIPSDVLKKIFRQNLSNKEKILIYKDFLKAH